MADHAERVYVAYLVRQRERAQRRAAADAATVAPPERYAGAPADVARALRATVDAVEEELFALSCDLYEHPEVGFEEVRSVGMIAELLGSHGVDTEVGAHGIPTSFRASAGRGSPCAAILAEYDALPGIGHGCGHNVIAAAAIGAFLAVRGVVGRTGGSVLLLGTPAEENGGGKELVLRAGGFDDVDAAAMVHPDSMDAAVMTGIIGRRDVRVVYKGRPAHAAGRPFLGRNALDAAVAAYQAVALLRQHMLPADRVNGIVTDGGQAVNVVPERAALRFFVRSPEPETLAELSARVDDVLRAAALSTGTECQITWDVTPPYLPMRHNRALAGRYVAALAGMRDVLPSYDSGESGGSSDMGNVSHVVPSIHPTIALVDSTVPGHSAELARHTVTPAGRRAVRDGAVGLAGVVADFLCDPKLRDDAVREFDAAGGRLRADAAGHRGGASGAGMYLVNPSPMVRQ